MRAFANAARAVEGVEGDLEAMVSVGRNPRDPRYRQGNGGRSSEISEGGRPAVVMEGWRENAPKGVRDMLRIAGLGAEKGANLWRDLEITSPGRARVRVP